MSKLGRRPITVPEGVQIDVTETMVKVKGPKGSLSAPKYGLKVFVEDNMVKIERPNDQRFFRSIHGTLRQLIHNMIVGVTKGHERRLKIEGIGYRAHMKGKSLILQVGYAEPVEFTSPEAISISVQENNRIIVSGIDKQLVGQVAASIRSVRPPDRYKGKGIRYEGEYIKLKPGKTGIGKEI